MKRFFLFVALSLASLAQGEEPLTIEETVPAPESPLFGLLELRPSYPAAGGSGFTENTARLGVRLSPTLSLDYTQYFSTPLTGSFTLDGEGSFVRLTQDEIWTNAAQNAFLAWELRAELPTGPGLQESGLVTAIRNDLKVDHQALPGLWLTYRVGASFGIYQTNGYWPTDTEAVANPWFQGRLATELFWEMGSGWTVFLPVTLTQTKRRFFDDEAPRNGQWATELTLWPELTYALSPNVYLGLSYSTANLLQEDLGGFRFGEGFENGVAQVIFGAKL